MLAICRKRFIFLNEDATAQEQTTTAGRYLTVVSSEPQELPDWVRETGTYQAGKKDGSIVDVRFSADGLMMLPVSATPTEVDEQPKIGLPQAV